MANIKHATLTGANLHEPKGVAAASQGQVYVADGGGSGAWKKINQTDNIDYSVVSKNQNGFNIILDNAYTSASPRALVANTRVAITNNGLKAGTDQIRLGAVWNATTSDFTLTDLNSAYILRVNYKITAAATDATPYAIKLEAEHDNPVGSIIYGNTQYVKGGSYVNNLVTTDLFFVGPSLQNSNLKLYVTPDTAMSMYDISFMLQRTYKES